MKAQVQAQVDIPVEVPEALANGEWYANWLEYFTTVEALFVIATVSLGLWVTRVAATFFTKDIRILLLSDAAVGLLVGMGAGHVWFNDMAAGFATAAIIFIVSVIGVLWLLRKAGTPFQHKVGNLLRGNLKESHIMEPAPQAEPVPSEAKQPVRKKK